jgi:hypothetical protein
MGQWEFLVEPSIGGLSPDFLVHLANGESVVIEVKGWNASEVNVARAQDQAETYRIALEAADAIVVLPQVPPDVSLPSVVAVDDLPQRLRNLELRRSHSSTDSFLLEEPKPILFCAMPFDQTFDDVFFVAMRGAAKANNMTARRVDQDEFNGDILSTILELIKDSEFVVADLSDAHPNVLYEAGFAHGLDKPVIHICSTPLSELPFDVSHNNSLIYSQGRTHSLTAGLARRIGSALG